MNDTPKYTAFIPLIKESELTAFELELGGKTLLARTVETAQSARSVDRVVVRSDDRNARKLASKLGVDCVPTIAAAREHAPHFLASALYPFKGASHFEQLAQAEASNAAVLTKQRHHPVASFSAKKGCMDFSATLDGPDWRELDEKIFYQPLSTLSLHFAPGTRRRAYFVTDEISAFAVTSTNDLELAQLILERGLFSKGQTWQSL